MFTHDRDDDDKLNILVITVIFFVFHFFSVFYSKVNGFSIQPRFCLWCIYHHDHHISKTGSRTWHGTQCMALALQVYIWNFRYKEKKVGTTFFPSTKLCINILALLILCLLGYCCLSSYLGFIFWC